MLHSRGSAHQEVQDPVTQGGAESQISECGEHKGTECWTVVNEQHRVRVHLCVCLQQHILIELLLPPADCMMNSNYDISCFSSSK